MIRKFIAKYFDSQMDHQLRIYRMILLMVEAGLLLNVCIYVFILRQGPEIFLLPCLGAVFLWFAFILSAKVKNIQNLYFCILLLVNMALLPIGFFTSGGVESGNPICMLLGLLLVFLLLSGWRFAAALILSILSVSITYLAAVFHPEWVVHLTDHRFVQQDSFFAMVLACIIIGVLIRYQVIVYRREKEISEQRSREIEEISKSKSLFFANMSHEIRTPINSIIGLNEMILRETVLDEVAENAIHIQDASRTLLSLVNDILDLSKIESGKMEIVPARYETAEMFRDLINIIWIRARQKNLELRIDIDPDLPSVLWGDEVRIKQVLSNLLSNAVKYTEKGFVLMTVRSEPLGADSVRLIISVEDTGIGIRKENLEDLFSVFKRVDQEKNRAIEGTGLGLSICRHLMDLMGGTIAVDSIYQKGSCFTIHLDQKIVDAVPVGMMQLMERKGLRDRQAYQQSFEAPGARVLIVDDNEMNLMVVKKLLRRTRVQVDTAASGRECLDKTQAREYHVILMDYVMPEMDGEETLQNLRSRREGYCQKTPVIALTANVVSGGAQWYRDKGFEGYLAKPISGNLLEAALMEMLPPELLECSSTCASEQGMPGVSAMVFRNRKKRICITTDCVCDLPEKWLKKLEIRSMYCYVVTDNGRFVDTEEIRSEALLDYMRTGGIVRVECASAKEYETFFADRLMEAEKVIHICAAAGIGNSYKTAIQAAKGFDNVIVLDSGHISGGMGMVVLHAAKMAQEGADPEEICGAVARFRERVHTDFILCSAGGLYNSGCIPASLRDFCRFMRVHPVFHIRNNRLMLKGVYSGRMESAGIRYVQHALQKSRNMSGGLLLITYAGCSARMLERIRTEAEKCTHFSVVEFQKASAAMSGSCGEGCFGVSYMRK